MTDRKTTETPWKGLAVIGLQKDATPFSFEQTEIQEHTLIMGPTRMGMSRLVRQNDATMDVTHGK
ncbi:hypothetical protein CRM93_12165 [Acetobacter fabarum]|uniref:Uncharacterized protein n=1 Tax=Acetobacter fabarum TaxID=483199 RepID=A0A269XWK7_9PROT|nr:hypothetical protein B8X00_10005 [Acetobacter fabarum]PEN23263.1 hypothetical protein CRM93_12165 [Acetobacter fabarum]